MQLPIICVTALAAALLQSSYSSAAAYERPVHTIVACFILSVIFLQLSIRYFPILTQKSDTKREEYELVNINGPSDRAKITDNNVQESTDRQPERRNFLLGIAVFALALRIEVFRQISNDESCTNRSYEVFLPLLIALCDLWKEPKVVVKVNEELLDSSVYDDLFARFSNIILRSKWRYIPSILFVTFGNRAITSLWRGRTSNVICPIFSGHAAGMVSMQLVALVLDALLAMILGHLILDGHQPKFDIAATCSFVLVGASGGWVLVTLLLLITNIDNGYWIFMLDTNHRVSVLSSVLWHAVLFSTLMLAALRLMLSYGSLQVVTLISTFCTLWPAFKLFWYTRQPFPPFDFSTCIWSFIATFLGLWSFSRIRQAIDLPVVARAGTIFTCSILVLLLMFISGVFQSNTVHFHPIDLLLYDARNQHERYLRYAKYSENLSTAVAIYSGRYKDNPPPGFDLWWQYAQERSAVITDDYDQIYMDLLPFRNIAPDKLRRMVSDMTSDPHHNIASISIRAGVVQPQNSPLATDQWMLNGVVELIDKFAKFLPDMDLAFNLNEEPRIAVKSSRLSDLRKKARTKGLKGSQHWSPERASGWLVSRSKGSSPLVFEDWSRQNSFTSLMKAACQSSSLALNDAQRTPQPYLCAECAQPHSFGLFLSNWSSAADLCHQPDLAHLHGFFASPTTLKVSRELMPVFSNAKSLGFNDILYPSVWNYLGETAYSPVNLSSIHSDTAPNARYPDLPFSQKVNSLYWRGSSSEGTSSGNRVWRSMMRQRFVHMTNNLTTSHHDHATVLLPNPSKPGKYTYQSLSAAQLLSLGLQTNIHFVDNMANCGGRDCLDQENEFGVVAPANFQENWKYRFLFDLDGAGSTGRFIPFLQSHSLPFKAGIFREWYDSRLTPWRHFVPQDVRLHGLWSTLAYFAGVDGSTHDHKIQWQPHIREAEMIAEQGRNWANRVLRKEDMEIYMFRLLLEWGRLTDDKRDELGFTLQ